MKKALIAMSGGVDSSVAALLTKNMGYDCIGATMILFDKEKESGLSTDATDAKKICDKFGFPFYALDYKKQFRENVINNFISSYQNGKTPNPCIECNKYLKFNELLKKAEELGCEKIVTGHYALTEEKEGRFYLKKAKDLSKDQSYVLYNLSEEQLSKIVFPLGELTKEEARKIAEENGFVNAHKKDSQDICFVPNGDYVSVIEKLTGKKWKRGNFIDVNNNVIGTHDGMIKYTIGQRKGINMSFNKKMYVKSKNAKTNEVMLCEHEDLFSYELTASNFNWINGIPNEPIKIKAKIRYNQIEQSATAYPLENNKAKIVFDEAQRAIAGGQAVVLYDGDYVIGGGTID